MPRPYFSLHGDEKDGWSLMLYAYATDSAGRETGAVCPQWRQPKQFDSLQAALAELIENETPTHEGAPDEV